MNKSNWIQFFLLFLIINLSYFSLASASKIDPREVMLKNEDVRKLKDIQASAVLMTGTPGSEKVKKFTWWRKLKPNHIHYNTLTRFHEPAEIKNESILFLENENDESDVFLYLPTYKKVRRVERSNQSGSFMGSELSYADIATPHVDDFNFKLIKTDSCPLSTNLQCYVIESLPKRKETLERTGYSRSVQWIRTDNFMFERAEHFDLDGKLFKVVLAKEIKEVDTLSHKWMSLHIEVENKKNNKHTVMKFSNLKVNQGIDDALFTQQYLLRLN